MAAMGRAVLHFTAAAPAARAGLPAPSPPDCLGAHGCRYTLSRMKRSLAFAVLVVLGLIAVGAATVAAHRGREHAQSLRASVAKLPLPALLRSEHACERDPALDPAYCQAVTHAIASQPLQLVEVPPNVVSPFAEPRPVTTYEHDHRSIAWPGKSRP
jgi:hypothetical protein